MLKDPLHYWTISDIGAKMTVSNIRLNMSIIYVYEKLKKQCTAHVVPTFVFFFFLTSRFHWDRACFLSKCSMSTSTVINRELPLPKFRIHLLCGRYDNTLSPWKSRKFPFWKDPGSTGYRTQTPLTWLCFVAADHSAKEGPKNSFLILYFLYSQNLTLCGKITSNFSNIAVNDTDTN